MIAETHSTSERLPKSVGWMSRVLLAAAVYNLLWGLFVVARPNVIFRWAGFDPMPVYPEMWQGMGMIVAVYGVGFGIASTNPARHWPIVFVGLIGKILAPIGFAIAVANGRLPMTLGWTILTNDLIWWMPFLAILWHAAKVNQSKRQAFLVPASAQTLNPLSRQVSQLGSTLDALSRRNPVLVVFLRHSGCIFCREALADIASQRKQIEDHGASIALVHMGQAAPADLLEKYGLSDLHCFRDPHCVLYDAFGLKIGGVQALLGPTVWWRGFRAFLSGHRPGPLNGNGFRLAGVFLLHRSKVVRAFIHTSAADRPEYAELAKQPGDGELLEDAELNDLKTASAASE